MITLGSPGKCKKPLSPAREQYSHLQRARRPPRCWGLRGGRQGDCCLAGSLSIPGTGIGSHLSLLYPQAMSSFPGDFSSGSENFLLLLLLA